MKIISFNINGLRARPHQLQAIVEQHNPDIIGLQETKVHDEVFPVNLAEELGYQVYFHGQKAHYGVALLSRKEPEAIIKGFRRMTKNLKSVLSSAGLYRIMAALLPFLTDIFRKANRGIIRLNFLQNKNFTKIYWPTCNRITPQMMIL